MFLIKWRKCKVYSIFLRHIPIEAIVWLLGLIFLVLIDPITSNHWSICPLKNLGLDFCLGCGLGTSMHYLFHGNFYQSWQIHPLGIVAVPILLSRIIVLTKSYFRKVQFK